MMGAECARVDGRRAGRGRGQGVWGSCGRGRKDGGGGRGGGRGGADARNGQSVDPSLECPEIALRGRAWGVSARQGAGGVAAGNWGDVRRVVLVRRCVVFHVTLPAKLRAQVLVTSEVKGGKAAGGQGRRLTARRRYVLNSVCSDSSRLVRLAVNLEE